MWRQWEERLKCFKSCPREGATDLGLKERPVKAVSSHAPVRGQRG